MQRVVAVITICALIPLSAQTPAPTPIVQSTPVVIQGTPTNYSVNPSQPAMTPALMRFQVQGTSKGSVVCFDHEGLGSCGTTDADYVGAYALKTTCDSGFYDMVRGGTCWKCPDDDGNGAFVRSADSVEKDTACWRVPKENFAKATYVKGGWSWECGSGEFWDPHDQNGNYIVWGGACWKCTEPNPRRTGFGINDSKACASSTNETKPAILLKYNGCPAPDMETMYPERATGDKRMPGQPFMDIASGITVAQAGAACFTCPVADKDGNFLISDRNANTLIGRKTGNSGCTIRFKYKPSIFSEPGLSGLAGVKEVLFEKRIFVRPEAITKYLYALADAKKLTGAAATQSVATDWQDIAAHPYRNSVVRALVYLYMTDQAAAFLQPDGIVPKAHTPAEAILVKSFESYMQSKRTYVAQQALDMYDGWKGEVDTWNRTHAQSQLQTAFNYGDVPLNFKGTIGAIVTASGYGLGIAGSLAGAQAFASGVQLADNGVATVKTSLYGMKILQAGIQSVGVVGGAMAIAAAGAIMASIAMDQFIEIQTARPKLAAALENAKRPVKLDDMLKTADDPKFYWILATGNEGELEDGQIVAMAQAAFNAAKQNNFARPN